MLRRGCTLILGLFLVIFATYLWFFTRYFVWRGNLIAAGLVVLFCLRGVVEIGHLLVAWRDTGAFLRAARRTPPAVGLVIVAAGPIPPLGCPYEWGGETLAMRGNWEPMGHRHCA